MSTRKREVGEFVHTLDGVFAVKSVEPFSPRPQAVGRASPKEHFMMRLRELTAEEAAMLEVMEEDK